MRLSDQTFPSAFPGSTVVLTQSGSIYEFTVGGSVYRYNRDDDTWDLWISEATWLPLRHNWRACGVYGPDDSRFETSTVVELQVVTYPGFARVS